MTVMFTLWMRWQAAKYGVTKQEARCGHHVPLLMEQFTLVQMLGICMLLALQVVNPLLHIKSQDTS